MDWNDLFLISNFNGCIVEVRDYTLYWACNYLSILGLKLYMLVKWAPGMAKVEPIPYHESPRVQTSVCPWWYYENIGPVKMWIVIYIGSTVYVYTYLLILRKFHLSITCYQNIAKPWRSNCMWGCSGYIIVSTGALISEYWTKVHCKHDGLITIVIYQQFARLYAMAWLWTGDESIICQFKICARYKFMLNAIC